MTVLEFWGCALISFGPTVSMFGMTVAQDPIKVILFITSAFYWLMSFLAAAIVWAVISSFCDYLIIGAYLAVLSQEIIESGYSNEDQRNNRQSTRSNAIQLGESIDLKDRIPLSYVSGLGFGLMNAAFSLTNVLTDFIGPGTVGLKGDSHHFLLVSSLTALAFTLLNVAWSVLMSESIEKSDRRLTFIVIITHLMATTVTFVNRFSLQLISVVTVYMITMLCGLGAFQVAGLSPKRLLIS